MDFERSHQSPQTYQPEPSPPQPQHLPHQNEHKKGGGFKKLLLWLLFLILLAGAAAGAYYYRDMEAKDQLQQSQTQIDELEAKNAKLQADLNAAKEDSTAAAKPSQATLDNIADAVKSGNYAALQQLMADKVKVIIAASEGLGDRTPAQAVADVKYLDAGTDPWNFALDAATLKDYQEGDYTQYFPTDAFVGKSANNYVVSFTFDDSAKISGIFMAANAETL